jgi:predicted dehydrogenase
MPEPQEQQSDAVSRRDVIKLGVVTAGSLAMASSSTGLPVRSVSAASEPLRYGFIGTGSRGAYLLKHLSTMDGGRCVAVCDVDPEALAAGAEIPGSNPRKYKDYRELLAGNDVDAVMIAVPLYAHFQITRDAIFAGKSVFCEKSLVFKPDEVRALRAVMQQHPRQILQVGLQRRYSLYFQAVKSMIDSGVLGKVTHIHGQWHRNPGWTMKPGGKNNPKNWRLFREFSGGLTAELASHHIDVANWFFGASPEFVVGVGGLDTWKDGRDVNDNIQLIFSYPNGRKMMYSAITTCQHLPMLNSQRPEFGLVIMGTAGAVELTLGSDNALPTALWFQEPQPTEISYSPKRSEITAGATFAQAGPQRGIPIITPETQIDWKNDSFLTREQKLARRWLYSKGVMLPVEHRNPVDTCLESFLNDARSGKTPRADLEVGLADSIAVILANLAMDQGRRVMFSEIETLGLPSMEPAPVGVTAELLSHTVAM